MNDISHPQQDSENPNPADSIDLDAFNTMRSNVGDVFTQIVIAFNASAADVIEKLLYWDDTRTAEELIRYPHSLKSISANVGAMRLSQLAADCEKLATSGDKDRALSMANTLNKEYENVKKRLIELGY